MRRSKRHAASKAQGNTTLSSSDETQHEQTMDIINKMSKQLLGSKETRNKTTAKKMPDGKNKKIKSSTPIQRVTRSRSKPRLIETDYEGDVDTSTESTTTTTTTSPSSDSSSKSTVTDLYDFDQSDEDSLRLVLFPDQKKKPTKASTKSKQKAPKTKNTKENKSSQKAKSSPIPQTGVKPLSSLKPSNTNTIQSPVKPAAVKGVKRKMSDSISPTNKKKVATPEISLMDSGVFMSPIPPVQDTPLHTPDVTPIPTPSLSLSTISVDDKSVSQPPPRLEYDSLLEPPLSMSPVKETQTKMSVSFSPARHQKSEPMDVGSPNLKSPLAEKNYAHRGLYMSPLERRERLQKQKKSRSKPRITTKKIDNWASKMNAEFAEIEMYNLSIEDQ